MFKIIIEQNPVIYDETGWDYFTFYTSDTLKNLIQTQMKNICQIEFLVIERAIVIRMSTSSDKTILQPYYWCRDVTPDLLNFMCTMPEFHTAVKCFFLHGNRLQFSIKQYPYLATIMLGQID